MSEADPAAVEIDLPADWDRADLDTPQALVLARPQSWRGAFLPTVTVNRSRTPGIASLADYRDAQFAGLVSLGALVVHMAASYRPCAHLDLVLALDQLGHDVTVAQRHLLAGFDGEDGVGSRAGVGRGEAVGCTAVVATAAAADEDWPGLAPLLTAVVRSVRTALP